MDLREVSDPIISSVDTVMVDAIYGLNIIIILTQSKEFLLNIAFSNQTAIVILLVNFYMYICNYYGIYNKESSIYLSNLLQTTVQNRYYQFLESD